MSFIESYEKFNDKEKQMFSNVCNQLLFNNFLSKDKKDTKDAYYFVLNYKRMFDEYFEVMGWEVILSTENGAIQLYNRSNKNMLRLKKNESIILIILRILYQEKVTSYTDSGNTVSVKVDEIHQKYESLEYKKKIYKTDLVQIIRMFKRFNLIEPQGDVTRGSCDVIIYPTILLAVNNYNIEVLYELLQSYDGGMSDEEAN